MVVVLFNSAVSCSDYIESAVRVINKELKETWKEVVMP
jgi:hypothetical protein